MRYASLDLFNLKSIEFLRWIWSVMLQLMCSLGFVRVYKEHCGSYPALEDSNLEKRRAFLFGLGASWLFGLFWQVLLLAAVVTTSWLGWWSWIWSGSAQLVPPMWILTLGDTSWMALSIISALAVGLSFSVGISGVGLAFVGCALFVGALSTQAALLILFAERLGLWLLLVTRSYPSPRLKADVVLRLILAAIFFLIQWVLGGVVIHLVRLNITQGYGDLLSRFFELGYLYFWWAALESLVSLFVFHYYYRFLFKKRTT